MTTTSTTATIDGLTTAQISPFLKVVADASTALNAKFGNLTADEAALVDVAAIAAVLDPVLAPYAAILPVALPVVNLIGNWIVSTLKIHAPAPAPAAGNAASYKPSIFDPVAAPRWGGAPRAI